MADNTKKEKKSFFKGMKSELKKVIWPTSKQVTNKTIAVIVLVLLVSGIVVLLDLGLEWTTDKLIYGKLQSAIRVDNNENTIEADNGITVEENTESSENVESVEETTENSNEGE